MRSLMRLKSSRSKDDQRDETLVALGAGDLAAEELVEQPAVVKPGERVELGLLARLRVAARVRDRRAGPARERVEGLDGRQAKRRLAGTRDRGERADRVAVGAQREREGGAGQPRARLDVVEPVAVGDLDRGADRGGPASGR